MAVVRPDDKLTPLWEKVKSILESAVLLWGVIGLIITWVVKNELRISHLEWDSAQYQQQLTRIDQGQTVLRQDMADIKGDIRYIRGMMEQRNIPGGAKGGARE